MQGLLRTSSSNSSPAVEAVIVKVGLNQLLQQWILPLQIAQITQIMWRYYEVEDTVGEKGSGFVSARTSWEIIDTRNTGGISELANQAVRDGLECISRSTLIC